jgi:Protein ENHANCED DISEASE RESISTANCE 2, C-terminal
VFLGCLLDRFDHLPQVVGLCRGYAKNIVNDVGIVIQGEQDGELPERILAVGSLNRINVNIRQKLD